MGTITIGTRPPFEAVVEIGRMLEQEIGQRDLGDIYVDTESFTKGFRVTAIPESDPFSIGRADITIYQKRDWSPPSLALDNIARWFPDKTLEIPLVEINVKSRNDVLSPSDSRRLFSTAEHVLDVSIYLEPVGRFGQIGVTSEDEIVYYADEIEEIPGSELMDVIVEHIRANRDDELYSGEELRGMLNKFKPDVFHFNEVFTAYREGRTKILIVLLSVFFEGYIEELVEEAMEDARENDDAGRFYSDWDFKESLNACRFFGIIDDNEYRIIDQIRDERNDYAHEPETFHPDTTSQVLESGTLDEAIQLYEEIIGVKDSMLND